MDIKCDYCFCIVGKLFVKCNECFSVTLCLQCFSNGVELESHKLDHAYCFEPADQNKDHNVFGDGWSFEEEDLLLDAVEHFGFGSWFDVADFVKSRNEKECEEHYLKYYLDGNLGQVTQSSTKALTCKEEYAGEIADEDEGIVQELTILEQKELGYMVLRDDFERDYDNEAESSISSVCLHYTDSPVDIAYKIFQVEGYRERQKGRTLRKVIAKNYKLFHDSTSLGFRSYCTGRKKRTREMKLFQAKFMPLAKFMDKSSFYRLYSKLNRQMRLMKHIGTLFRIHKRGVRKLTGNLRRINGTLNGKKKRKKKSCKCYK